MVVKKYWIILLLALCALVAVTQAQDQVGHDHAHDEVAHDHDHDHDHGTAVEPGHDHTSEPHTHEAVDPATHQHVSEPGHDSAAEAGHEVAHDHSAEAGHSHAGHSHGSESCEAEAIENYDMGMRVGSIFILMVTSAVGIFAPIILHRIHPYSKGDIRDWILTVAKFFGTGVILATAFIHMLPEALERFHSPCLSEGWHSYHGFGGLFCMIAALALQLIELAAIANLEKMSKQRSNSPTGSIEKGYTETHVHSAGLLEHDQALRNIGTLVLEFGIVMHSIIIGITLGTVPNASFTILLIALVFHQFFEGIALGTRVNELNCKTWLKPIIMGLLFIVMTPIGVAIGIGIRASVDIHALVTSQAILDSISAGILLYSGFVTLISSEINHNEGFRQSTFPRKAACFVSMYIGAALMAVLGTWA
ncbi:ZIP zinc transporter-domain-containing protein [Radiomyces spectabilis]|uniref:ZIP zinc transporter-domain-containing protein n=1 Tax=Radiomyces spectabilis TaxID=64574 RepID=UPI00221E7C61|nr:ZIP zinc transporter-domain-containing protein [Radiomyces spectabilis]KAI8374123.1 ZIP zinc transporter-domain-containing protein [Radiomyces spectabilis]